MNLTSPSGGGTKVVVSSLVGLLLPILLALGVGPIASAPGGYLERGNALIADGSYAECRALFEEALQEDPQNLAYRSQLGLCLSGLGEYDRAAEELGRVLSVEPDHVGALWYLAVNRHQAGDNRASIRRLRQVEPLLDQRSPQRAALYWYRGSAYRGLLASEGLRHEEIDSMVAAFGHYLELQPEASDRDELETWLRWVEENRPAEESGKRWLAIPRALELEGSTAEAAALGSSIEQAELPEPAPGFVWRKLPDFGVAFQMPEAWHFKKEVTDQARAFFMTKENIDESGSFLTGLTLNLVIDARDRVGLGAVEYAERFTALTCNDGKKLDAWQRQVGVLRSFTCTVARTVAGRPIVVHHLAIGNERTDTLFLVFFESPVESWKGEWDAVGSKMMEFFAIDDEI